MSDNSSKYETTVKLPSKGIIYENIPEDLTIRAMTTSDEKVIFGSTNSDALDKVIRKCVVNPDNLDTSKLTPADMSAILIKLRTHTYGSEYTMQGRCPECNKVESYDINLDELPITYLEDDFKEPIEVTLPVSGDVLSVRLLRNNDYKVVSSQAKKIAKKMRINSRELEFIYRMARHILQINGEDVDQSKAQEYVSNMVGKDSAYYSWKLGEVANFGIDTSALVECKDCGEEFELPFEINSEFFRPKFNK